MKNLVLFLGIMLTSFHASSAKALSWETALTCNGGAAILQVNRDDRRFYQFIVKDPSVIVYFNGSGAFRNAGNNFGNGREFIVSGGFQRGMFRGSDFQNTGGFYNRGDSFSLEQMNAGLKISLKNQNAWSACDGDVSPSTGMCSGNTRHGVDVHEYANWYFDRCE